MANTVSACENVCQDFSWLFSFLKTVAENPVWALTLGALISFWIWRRQTKLSFHLQELAEKRTVFRDFLNKADIAIDLPRTGDFSWGQYSEMKLLLRVGGEIKLLAGKDVVEASEGLIGPIITYLGSDEPKQNMGDGTVIYHLEKSGNFKRLLSKKCDKKFRYSCRVRGFHAPMGGGCRCLIPLALPPALVLIR